MTSCPNAGIMKAGLEPWLDAIHTELLEKTPRILLCVHALAQNLSLSDETIACVWQPVNQPVHPVSMSV